jgi:hypothetical protein
VEVAVPVEAMSLAVLVELVNGWATTPRDVDGRGDQAYPAATDIASRLGVPTSVSSALTNQDLAQAADCLHPVFAATDAAECAQLITRLLTKADVRPALTIVAGHPSPTWLVTESRNAVLASAAVALRQYVADHGSDRLGVCTGRCCAHVYVDTSPTGRRRFCSITCQNRTRVAAFRSRRSGA